MNDRIYSKLGPIIYYIFSLLLGGNEGIDKISYGKEINMKTLVTIKSSGFFDDNIYMTSKSLPNIPLAKWHGIPLLFGEPKEEIVEGHMIIYADIIASIFFLISRYEEIMVTENRDDHGRFMGQGSLPGREGFLEQPVVDQYGKQFRELLRIVGIMVKEPNMKGKIYLTHDVDVPWKKWNLISALRNSIGYTRQAHKLALWPLQNFFGDYSHNPFDTFDWMIQMDTIAKQVQGKRCETIYFIIGASKSDKYTESYIEDIKSKELVEKLKKQSDFVGLHISYSAGKTLNIEDMKQEKATLEKFLEKPVKQSRNHYLLSKKPDAFRDLISIGITDDYTMGYADRVGFRLGTAQCIRWIDPERLELTKLKLHPLIIMECSLSAKNYMGMNQEECMEKIKMLYKNCESVRGDFCVLFHNSVFMPGPNYWLKEVYQNMIEMFKENQ
ncbi:MAG: hypothetical protein HFG53_05625 [Lachnospiraceae bacterium]|jgi:hypothetical protein|nr:hypothetical protein [Lachnospiraceae bacterium]